MHMPAMAGEISNNIIEHEDNVGRLCNKWFGNVDVSTFLEHVPN